MNTLNLQSVVALAAFALLTACGGYSPDQADATVSTAAQMVFAPAPVADCDAEGGCNGPRIIDGMAEQYRAGAIALQQAEQQQALQPTPVPVPTIETVSESPTAAAVPAQ